MGTGNEIPYSFMIDEIPLNFPISSIFAGGNHSFIIENDEISKYSWNMRQEKQKIFFDVKFLF